MKIHHLFGIFVVFLNLSNKIANASSNWNMYNQQVSQAVNLRDLSLDQLRIMLEKVKAYETYRKQEEERLKQEREKKKKKQQEEETRQKMRIQSLIKERFCRISVFKDFFVNRM
jgi:hypothetical protein